MKDRLQYAWRWFGEKDPVSLPQVKQTGAKSVVTALHKVPIGEIWEPEEIIKRKQIIESAGLRWTVVESVPVHEDIKLRRGKFENYIENYIQTIRNLGEAGIETLCYNFMPVLDWSRTDLEFTFDDGTESLSFNHLSFAIIDIFLLKRPGARASYPDKMLEKARALFENMDHNEKERLSDTFLLGLPGSGETFSMEEVRRKIGDYKHIESTEFKANLKHFIGSIVPVAEEQGIQLAIHPDDPPWPLMGLPKALSTLKDAQEIIEAYDSPNNGITFCTGSFGAAKSNDLPLMAEELAHRINFAHLRNVSRDEHLNFHEAQFFEGDIDMANIMSTLVRENIKRYKNNPDFKGIPVRPDHGARILGDFSIDSYPGYPLYGRLKNLAEIAGLETGLLYSISHSKVT